MPEVSSPVELEAVNGCSGDGDILGMGGVPLVVVLPELVKHGDGDGHPDPLSVCGGVGLARNSIVPAGRAEEHPVRSFDTSDSSKFLRTKVLMIDGAWLFRLRLAIGAQVAPLWRAPALWREERCCS